MEISTFAWQIFGLLGMPERAMFSRTMSQVGPILLPVLLQWLVGQLQNVPGLNIAAVLLLMPRIYDAAVDGVSDSQTHSGGIATPASVTGLEQRLSEKDKVLLHLG